MSQTGKKESNSTLRQGNMGSSSFVYLSFIFIEHNGSIVNRWKRSSLHVWEVQHSFLGNRRRWWATRCRTSSRPKFAIIYF